MFTIYLEIGSEIVKSSKVYSTSSEAEDALREYLSICEENGFNNIKGFVI